MILLVLAVLFLSIGLPLFLGGHRRSFDWDTRSIYGNLLQIAGAVLLVVTVIVNLVAYGQQVGDKNSVIQYRQNETIYKAKAANLTAQFRGYLAVQYPKFEQQIYSTFTHSPKLLFAAFPQLQSSTTLIALTQQIGRLQNQVYDQETNITQAEKNLRTRRGNPFYVGFLLP